MDSLEFLIGLIVLEDSGKEACVIMKEELEVGEAREEAFSSTAEVGCSNVDCKREDTAVWANYI